MFHYAVFEELLSLELAFLVKFLQDVNEIFLSQPRAARAISLYPDRLFWIKKRICR